MPKPASVALPGTEIIPDSQLEKRTRRRFSADYKLRILIEADQCRRGELGELLRRERLYYNQLSVWRRELAEGGAAALSKTLPGPKPKYTPEAREIERLKRDNAKLQRKLEIAEGCIELQKTFPPARTGEQRERQVIAVLDERPSEIPLASACRELGVGRSGLYDRRKRRAAGDRTPATARRHSVQPRALSAKERDHVHRTLTSPRFRDQPPAQVYQSLLDDGVYLLLPVIDAPYPASSWAKRRPARPAATSESHDAAPGGHGTQHGVDLGLHEACDHQSWRLPDSLSVVLDLFSRYVLARMVSRKENAALACQLMNEAAAR